MVKVKNIFLQKNYKKCVYKNEQRILYYVK